LGKGQNVENQNVKSLKVDQKFEKGQNIESIFFYWTERQKWSGWSEHWKSEHQKEVKSQKWLLTFWFFLKRSTTYGILLPMCTKACGGLG
jgi:hypothetical protein